MNDFTKEELEDILETYYQIAEHSDIELKVIDKIQSLIDNYCEHEWHTYPKDVTAIPLCKKCGKLE